MCAAFLHWLALRFLRVGRLGLLRLPALCRWLPRVLGQALLHITLLLFALLDFPGLALLLFVLLGFLG
ncbi:hypothetical protein ACFQGW_17915 [Xanthomonas theicola]|uniref:hypothetical protein n=1 Tax=Xanthomonas theicola TaxID=56464 RepID=UPI003605B761